MNIVKYLKNKKPVLRVLAFLINFLQLLRIRRNCDQYSIMIIFGKKVRIETS